MTQPRAGIENNKLVVQDLSVVHGTFVIVPDQKEGDSFTLHDSSWHDSRACVLLPEAPSGSAKTPGSRIRKA